MWNVSVTVLQEGTELHGKSVSPCHCVPHKSHTNCRKREPRSPGYKLWHGSIAETLVFTCRRNGKISTSSVDEIQGHGPLTRATRVACGPPGNIMGPATTFVNYVYSINLHNNLGA
jgi:hypothetical protein